MRIKGMSKIKENKIKRELINAVQKIARENGLYVIDNRPYRAHVTNLNGCEWDAIKLNVDIYDPKTMKLK